MQHFIYHLCISLLLILPIETKAKDFDAIYQLIQRRLPQLAGKVDIKPYSDATDQETFTLQTKNNRLLIGASSLSAAGSAVYYYLREYCHQSISRCGDNLSPIKTLPAIPQRIKIQTPFKYRYALNYCTYNYTYSFYQWADWERELDWMALNGVNLMLAPMGMEKVWYETLQKIGFSKTEIEQFIPGPAYTAWWLMGNLEGWGGPMSASMREMRYQLQRKILKRMNELGIAPVIQGFNGMVPNLLAKKYPKAAIVEQGKWGAFLRPAVLLPQDPLFYKLADIYYESLKRNYGNQFTFLSGDLFHEGGKTEGIDLGQTAKLIQQNMQHHFPNSIWVLQGWSNNPKKELLDGLNKSQALVLNLAGEIASTWEATEQYYGTPWVWGSVNHFGGKTDMGGQLPVITQEPYRALQTGKNLLQGIGILPEGVNSNPIVYDWALKIAWQQDVDQDHLLRQWVLYRYGKWDEHAYQAWKILHQSVYGEFKIKGEGTFESILCARPGFNIKNVSTWGPKQMQYDGDMLIQALAELRQAQYEGDTYRYDLVDLARQVNCYHARKVYNRSMLAFEKKDKVAFEKDKENFLSLLVLQDQLVGTDPNFLLGRWLQQAKDYAPKGSKDALQAELNAKTLITYWGPDFPKTRVHDYANKEWSGFLADYYLPRWKAFYDNLSLQLDGKKTSDIDFYAMEKAWTFKKVDYSTQPTGDYRALVDKVMNTVMPPYKNPSTPIDARVDDLLQRMTLEEKIAQMRHIHFKHYNQDGVPDFSKLARATGGMSFGCIEAFPYSSEQYQKAMYDIQHYMRTQTRLGIPVISVMEGLHGVVQDGCTVFPQSIALGATFNTTLTQQVAQHIAQEMKAIGAKQVLAPNLDIARELRWGRVEETYGEDPYLVSCMGEAYTRGIQQEKLITTLKHFVAHGTPLGGLNLASVPGGKRELLRVYAKPFEHIIKTCNPLSVMNCYSAYDEEAITSSPYYLKHLLRDSLHFKGYVYSDWGSIPMLKYFHRVAATEEEAAIKAITAGVDLEAGSDYYRHAEKLLGEGKLTEKDIDQAVRHILYTKFASGLFDETDIDTVNWKRQIHTPQAIATALQAARESIVLLENKNQRLPLDIHKISSIAVIGPNADRVQFGDYSWTQNPKDGITPLEGIKAWVGNRAKIVYEEGCDPYSLDEKGIEKAVKAVKKSDIAIVCVGTQSALLARPSEPATCGEGYDLSDLKLPGVQEKLITEIARQGKPFIVVLVTGKPLETKAFNNRCDALLVQWYGGEQSGKALAEILFGEVNPSGKLPVSFPQTTGQLPCYYNHLSTDKGYYNKKGAPGKPGRDYVFANTDAQYPFGFGLSYSHFAYTGLCTNADVLQPNDTLHVTFDVTNKSDITGMEVPQLYIRDLVSSVATPVKQLYAFEKITLAPQETRTITLDVPVAEWAIYDQELQKTVEPGQFAIMVGSSSAHIALTDTISVGEEAKFPTASQQGLTQTLGEYIMVNGTVRNVQAAPLEGVTITVQSNKVHVTTDKKGNYSIRAQKGDTLVFTLPGYQKTSLLLTPNAIYDIEMVAKIE